MTKKERAQIAQEAREWLKTRAAVSEPLQKIKTSNVK